MDNADGNPAPTLGFLTVLEHAQHGLFGGYLILTAAGRPLEFHCTAPIKPNRAQEILYGPTLYDYLYGEQIGQALVNRGKIKPSLICTDRGPALAVREFVSVPVALVLPHESSAPAPDEELPSSSRSFRIDPPHGGPDLVCFQAGRNRLALPARAQTDRRTVEERLGDVAEAFDLNEPFERIRAAIEEAQQAVR
jgi:hypothetical protein